jgi:large subunit ribosomal protein L11
VVLRIFLTTKIDFLWLKNYPQRVPKKIVKVVKVQATGGAASPAPPLGPALGQAGVDIGAFIAKFNAATQDRKGQTLPVQVTVYEDRSFEFIVKSPPASVLIRQELGVEKGSGEPSRTKVGTITKEQVKKIAQQKLADLNTRDLEAAMRMIEGTARNMGVVVEG